MRRLTAALPALALALTAALTGALTTAPARALEPLGDRGLAVVNGGGGEFFLTPVPIDWTVAHSSSTDRVVHMAWLPEGQAVGSWSDKVSVQLFPGETRITGERLLDQIARRYERDCDSLLATETETARKRGRTVAFRLLGCTRHQATGRGEIALFRVVEGAESLYMVQRAWRTPTFDQDSIPFSREILGKTRLWLQGGRVCRADSPDAEHACPPRLAEAIRSTSLDQPVTVVKLGKGEAARDESGGGESGGDTSGGNEPR